MSGRRIPDPGLADEQGLLEDLQELQSRWCSDPEPQPPEQLDLAVLRAARAALPARRRRAWPWTRGWIHNLATAAVVVLAVTVLLQLRQAPPEEQADAASALPEPLAAPASAPVQLRKEQADEARTSGAGERALRSMRAAPNGARPLPEADSDLLQDTLPMQANDDLNAEVNEWLERMERLYADGEFTALAQEVERFRATYPDTPIPEHLLR